MTFQDIHLFTMRGRHFACHVDSSACVEIDSLASRLLPSIIEGKSPTLENPPIDQCSPEEIDRCTRECRRLLNEGPFSRPVQPYTHQIQNDVLAATLHISHDCNLACAYCYADTGAFGKTRRLMTPDVIRKAIDYVFAHASKEGNINIGFFGGEPLMNFEGIREGVAYAKACAECSGRTVSFSMTSNATLLTDKVMKMLSEEKFSLIFSLDGPPDVHDKMRRARGGRGTHARVLDKIHSYARRYNGDFTVRGTFTAATPKFSEQVVYLNEQGFTSISVEPAQLDPSHPAAIVTAEQIDEIKAEYERLAEVFLEWFGQGRFLHIFHFEQGLRRLLKPHPMYTECGAGGGFIAVTPEGQIYPCFEAVVENENCIGDIESGFDAQKRSVFQAMHVERKEVCRFCWVKHACGGGCHAFNIRYNGAIDKPYRPHCEFIRHRFMICAWLLAEINDRGEAAIQRLCEGLGVSLAPEPVALCEPNGQN